MASIYKKSDNTKLSLSSKVLGCLVRDNLIKLKENLSLFPVDSEKRVEQRELLAELLFAAAKKGATKCAQWLLDNQVCPNGYIDVWQRTPLLVAVNKGCVELMTSLLRCGANVNNVDMHGESALRLCASQGYPICLKLLIKHGAQTDLVAGPFTQTALAEASIFGRLHCVQLLLDAGAEVDHENSERETSLMLAAEHGNLACVQELVSRGADVLRVSAKQMTPLFYAAYGGNYETVKYLVQFDSRLDNTDEKGNNIFAAAFCSGNLFLVKLFLDKGASFETIGDLTLVAGECAQRGGKSCLSLLLEYSHDLKKVVNDLIFSAVRGDDVTCVELLLSLGADVNVQNDQKSFLIHEATELGANECLKFLLKQKVDVNARNKYGESALFFVITVGDADVAKILIDHGADVNLTNHKGKTAATLASSAKIVELLFDAGLDVHIQDKKGLTALMCTLEAALIDSTEMCEFYLSKGVDIEVTDADGCTALFHAAKNGANHSLSFLLKKGANINHSDFSGKTVLEYCVEFGLSGSNDCDTIQSDFQKCIHILLNSMSGTSAFTNDIVGKVLSILFFKQLWRCSDTARETLTKYAKEYLEIFLDFKNKYPFILVWCQNQFHDIILAGAKEMIHSLFLNGMYPRSIEVIQAEQISAISKPSYMAGILKYFIINNIVASSDVKVLKKIDVIEASLHAEESSSVGSLLLSFVSQPLPLVKLCLDAVSLKFCKDPGRRSVVHKSGLPPKLQRFLLHENDWSRLCPSQWDHIPIVTDSIEYENLPRPRPLLEHWPVGLDLEKCGCDSCGSHGLKFCGVECTVVPEKEFDAVAYFIEQMKAEINFDDESIDLDISDDDGKDISDDDEWKDISDDDDDGKDISDDDDGKDISDDDDGKDISDDGKDISDDDEWEDISDDDDGKDISDDDDEGKDISDEDDGKDISHKSNLDSIGSSN